MDQHSRFSFFLLSCIFLLVGFPVMYCYTANDTKTLMKSLYSDYDKNIRPIKNQSDPVIVKFGLGLMSIKEFDEVKESISVNSFFYLKWVDEFMTWNPEQYGGIAEIVRESSELWTPNLVLVNTMNELEKVGDSWQLIRFKNNGIASFYPGEDLEASCTVDVTYYPFDRHICSLNFTLWASLRSEVLLTKMDEKVYLMHFSENGAWNLVDSGFHISYSNHDAVNLDVLLLLERKPQFVVVNVLIPMVCLVFLNALTFVMPMESGERISFSISVLLSIAVFLTVTGDNLPKTSNPMPMLSFYLLTVLTISALTTVASVFSMWLYHRNASLPVSIRWKMLTKRFRHDRNKTYTEVREMDNCNNQEKLRHSVDEESRKEQGDKRGVSFTNVSDSGSFHESFASLCCDSVETGTGTFGRKWSTASMTKSDVSWKDVSATFDQLFFILCMTVLFVATVTYLLIVLTADRRMLPALAETVRGERS